MLTYQQVTSQTAEQLKLGTLYAMYKTTAIKSKREIEIQKLQGGRHESTYHHHRRNITPGNSNGSKYSKWNGRRYKWDFCLGILGILRNDSGSTGNTGSTSGNGNGKRYSVDCKT